MRVSARRFFLVGFVLFSACSAPAPLPTQFPEPTNTPKIVINIGPPNSGEMPSENPFAGTQLPLVRGRSPTDPPREVVMNAPVTQLPMIDIHGLPAVEVTINGAGPYHFVVDWGANLFAMKPQLAIDLNLPILGMDEMGNPNARVESLSIGETQFQDLTVALDPFFLNSDEDGVLGRNVFEKLLMSLDYPAQRVKLEEGSLPEPDGRTTFEYTPSEGGAPMLEMQLQDHPLVVVLDTGASRGLIIPMSEAEKFNFVSGPVPGGMAVGPQLNEAGTQVGRLFGELSIGDYALIEPVVVIIDRPEYLAGSGLLKYFAITLDQGHSRVRLHRNDSAPIRMPAEPWEGAIPTP